MFTKYSAVYTHCQVSSIDTAKVFCLPSVPEDQEITVSRKSRALLKQHPHQQPEEITKTQDQIQTKIDQDPNWKLHHGFSDSRRMAYFLPIHELVCTETPNEEAILKEMEQNPHSLLARESSFRRTPLHIACRMGAPDEIIQSMLFLCPKAAQIPDLLGRLPLHYACANNASYEVVSALIEAYPEGCQKPCKQGWLPLHIAISTRREVQLAMMLLFQYPEGVVMKTKGGNTALSLAKRRQRESILQNFLSKVFLSVESERKSFTANAA